MTPWNHRNNQSGVFIDNEAEVTHLARFGRSLTGNVKDGDNLPDLSMLGVEIDRKSLAFLRDLSAVDQDEERKVQDLLPIEVAPEVYDGLLEALKLVQVEPAVPPTDHMVAGSIIQSMYSIRPPERLVA